jgi:hypothetical protein
MKLRENIDLHPLGKTFGIAPLKLLEHRWPDR